MKNTRKTCVTVQLNNIFTSQTPLLWIVNAIKTPGLRDHFTRKENLHYDLLSFALIFQFWNLTWFMNHGHLHGSNFLTGWDDHAWLPKPMLYGVQSAYNRPHTLVVNTHYSFQLKHYNYCNLFLGYFHLQENATVMVTLFFFSDYCGLPFGVTCC
jgi:hypothetical protein